jgi:hypothetical protein
MNFRIHPRLQGEALRALYREIGFARSLLAYELPDGRLKLIDGHLRRDLDPDMEVEVEVLDVSEDEARSLLLSIDPLAALAETDTAVHQKLADLAETESAALQEVWKLTDRASAETESFLAEHAGDLTDEQFLVLVECRDEDHQRELLSRFAEEGLTCRALLS